MAMKRYTNVPSKYTTCFGDWVLVHACGETHCGGALARCARALSLHLRIKIITHYNNNILTVPKMATEKHTICLGDRILVQCHSLQQQLTTSGTTYGNRETHHLPW